MNLTIFLKYLSEENEIKIYNDDCNLIYKGTNYDFLDNEEFHWMKDMFIGSFDCALNINEYKAVPVLKIYLL